MNKISILNRIKSLKESLSEDINKLSPYKDLPENEKFKFRARQAEIMILEDVYNGSKTDTWLDYFIDREQYAAAEGMIKVNDWIKE